MKKLLSIMSILALGTTGSIYPVILQHQTNKQNNFKQVNILKLSNVRKNLENQLSTKVFSNANEVVNTIKSNSVSGLEYQATLVNSETSEKKGYQIFNVTVTIIDESKFKWDNNVNNSVVLTMSAFIDSRDIVKYSDIQNKLSQNFSSMIYDSSFDFKYYLLTNSEIEKGVSVVYIDPNETIINPDEKKLYQINYQVNVALDRTKKWDIIEKEKTFSITTNIDERVVINNDLISNSIEQAVKNKEFMNIEEAESTIQNVKIDDNVAIKNISVVNSSVKLATKTVKMKYDLVLKDNKNTKWKDNSTETKTFETNVEIENRKVINSKTIENELNSKFNSKTFKTMQEAIEAIKNNSIADEISVENISTTSSTIFGSAEFNVELKIVNTEENKWQDETVENKIVKLTTNIDGRKIVNLTENENKLSMAVSNKVYPSISAAQANLITTNIDNEIRIKDIRPNKETIYGEVVFSIELELQNTNLAKWDDGSTDIKTVNINTEIDGRKIVNIKDIQTIFDMSIKDQVFKSVADAAEFVKKIPVPKEVIVSNVSSTYDIKVEETIYGEVVFSIELELQDTNLAKWDDGSTENKTISIKTQIDGRKIVNIKDIQTIFDMSIKDQVFKSVADAAEFVKKIPVPKEVIVSDVSSTSDTKVGVAIIDVNVGLIDETLFKWDDETSEKRNLEIEANIDSRINLEEDLVNTYLGYFSFSDVSKEHDILQQLLKLNSELKIEELILSDISDNKATVGVKEGSFIYNKAESIDIYYERDRRVKVEENLVIDLGSFAIKKNREKESISENILLKNPNIKLEELEFDSMDLNHTQSSAKMSVKKGSKVYFESTIKFVFTIKTVDIPSFGSLDEPVLKVDRTHNMDDKQIAFEAFSKAFPDNSWDDIEIIDYDYSVNGDMTRNGIWKITALKDSLYYKPGSIGYMYWLEKVM